MDIQLSLLLLCCSTKTTFELEGFFVIVVLIKRFALFLLDYPILPQNNKKRTENQPVLHLFMIT